MIPDYVCLLRKYIYSVSIACIPAVMSTFPSTAILDLTEKVARYAQMRFCWYLGKKADPPGPSPPLEFNIQLVDDVEVLASQAARAFTNRGESNQPVPAI